MNDREELLTFKLTPGNVDDCKPVPEMAQGIFGKLHWRPCLYLWRLV
nr:transposase [Xenococcus sp. PCC 7305]